MKIQQGNTGRINFSSYFTSVCICLFHMPEIQADLPRLVASHELQNGTRARPLAMYPLTLQCKTPPSHLGSSLHPPLGLNADLLTFRAVFPSDLSPQTPDSVVVVPVTGVDGSGVIEV